MSSAKRIYLSSPTMNGDELGYVQEAFDTNWVAPLGKNVDGFECELAAYIGSPHAAALSSGYCGVGIWRSNWLGYDVATLFFVQI